MPGWGIQGAYNSLDQILAQRMLAAKDAEERQHYADKLAQQEKDNAYRDRSLQENVNSREAIARIASEDRAAAREDQQAQQQRTLGLSLNDAIPQGTALAPNSPSVGALRSIGAPLTHQDPALGSTQYSQALTPGKTAPMSGGMLRTVSQGHPEQFIKEASQKQLDTQQTQADRTADNARQDAHNAATERNSAAMLQVAQNRPPPLVMIQTQDADGNPITKIVPKEAGAEFKKPPNATVGNRLASAKAVTQTGEDIIAKLADPAYAQAVGVAMGRANSVRDFVGNPPPEFAELAGQIESYALANMGVHGMRSTQGAEQIKRLLDARHTPESLTATIKGLNAFSQHFMENETGTKGAGANAASGASGKKKTPQELIQQYGGR